VCVIFIVFRNGESLSFLELFHRHQCFSLLHFELGLNFFEVLIERIELPLLPPLLLLLLFHALPESLLVVDGFQGVLNSVLNFERSLVLSAFGD